MNQQSAQLQLSQKETYSLGASNPGRYLASVVARSLSLWLCPSGNRDRIHTFWPNTVYSLAGFEFQGRPLLNVQTITILHWKIAGTVSRHVGDASQWRKKEKPVTTAADCSNIFSMTIAV